LGSNHHAFVGVPEAYSLKWFLLHAKQEFLREFFHRENLLLHVPFSALDDGDTDIVFAAIQARPGSSRGKRGPFSRHLSNGESGWLRRDHRGVPIQAVEESVDLGRTALVETEEGVLVALASRVSQTLDRGMFQHLGWSRSVCRSLPSKARCTSGRISPLSPRGSSWPKHQGQLRSIIGNSLTAKRGRKIIAALLREGEELGRDLDADRVKANVPRTCIAAARPKETCHRDKRTNLDRFTEDVSLIIGHDRPAVHAGA
jgi:hypothetical protein